MTLAESAAVRVRAVSVPKAGSALAENEDAYAASPSIGRFAVADGATESSYSRAWASELVRAWAAGHDLSDGAEMPSIAARWRSNVPDPEKVPWYAATKLERGAHATFLGLTVRANGTFSIVAHGDACVFISMDGTVEVFPSMTSDEFGSTPHLLVSTPPYATRWQTTDGTWSSGAAFVLATDAVAAYLVARCVEQGESIERALMISAPRARRRQQLRRLRAAGAIRNDDLTYLAVTCQ